jgi:hypothetical protein
MTIYRNWATNQRIESQALKDASDADLWASLEASGASGRLSRAGIDGVVVNGCNWVATATTLTLDPGVVILRQASGNMRGWSTYRLPSGQTYTPTPTPSALLRRIDTVYVEASSDVTSVPGATYVRDPLTGVVTPNALNTRGMREVELNAEIGTELIATSWSPGSGNAPYEEVLAAPPPPPLAVPIAYVYVDNTGIAAVVDARPYLLSKDWQSGGASSAAGYVVFSPAGAVGGNEEVAGSDPTAWRWYGQKPSGGAGIGATIRTRMGLVNHAYPAAYRVVTPEGVMLSVPPGVEATSVGSANTRVRLDSSFNTTIAVDHTVIDAVEVTRWDAGVAGINPPFRSIQRGWLTGSRTGINADQLPGRRLTPVMIPQQYNASNVEVDIVLLNDDGTNVISSDMLVGGVYLKLQWRNNTGVIQPPDANIVGGIVSGCNVVFGTLLGNTGTAYIKTDDGVSTCTIEYTANIGTTDFDLVVEAEVVSPPQVELADPTYIEGVDARLGGAWRYAPGGKGLCRLLLA